MATRAYQKTNDNKSYATLNISVCGTVVGRGLGLAQRLGAELQPVNHGEIFYDRMVKQ